MPDHVYRICEAAAWASAQAEGQLPLSEVDAHDGYVHLSRAGQLADTLARYFAGREDLVVLTVACERLTDGILRYERPSRVSYEGRELFPHFYGRVPVAAITTSDPLPVDAGQHSLPPAIVRALELEQEDEDLGLIEVHVAWDEQRGLAVVEYPRPVRIEDEASMCAWEALLERRLSAMVERHGGKIPVVVGLDNLWVATKLERRYAELADKLHGRWFTKVARWTRSERRRMFFSRVNEARSLPSDVFDTREQAIAFVSGLYSAGERG